MDKIIRIHIAKVPYEVSAVAEAKLNKYLDEIRSELDADLADEIMADIEVRIAEILTERDVNRNDVITIKDIEAVQEQLGLPQQFSDSVTNGTPKRPNHIETKKLLRDTDNAYVGGVASGIGAYFGIDPIFIRLIFIGLTFASGLGILLYLLFWLLVPAAKTSSDRLLMRGEAVTVAALQRYRSTTQRTITNLRLKFVLGIICNVLRLMFTIIAAILIFALLSTVAFGSATLYTQPLHQLYSAYHLNYLLLGLLWLCTMTVIGLILMILLRLWRGRSSSLAFAVAILAGVLVLALAGVATVSPFIVNHYKNQYAGDKLAVAIPVHSEIRSVTPTTFTIAADSNLIVSYVVTSQPVHATYQRYPGMGQPDILISEKNGSISLTANRLSHIVPDCVLDWCKRMYLPVRVKVYGPALQKFTAEGGVELDLTNMTQHSLAVDAENNSDLSVRNSYVDDMDLSTHSGGAIDASSTTAQTATMSIQDGTSISGPATSTLKATLPLSCDEQLLELSQAPASITINGQPVTAQTFSQSNCVSLDSSYPTAPSVAVPEAPKPATMREP